MKKYTLIKTNFLYAITLFLTATIGHSQQFFRTTYCQLNGWDTLNSNTSYAYITRNQLDPFASPFNDGYAIFLAPETGPTGFYARWINSDYDGVKLRDLKDLSYFCFIFSHTEVDDALFLELQVDSDANGTVDTRLIFHPKFQTGNFRVRGTPDQGQIFIGQWKRWNAFDGGWYIDQGNPPDHPDNPAPLFKFHDFIKQYPDACLRNGTEIGGSVIWTGGGKGTGPNFLAFGDGFLIQVKNNYTIYDFEMEFLVCHEGAAICVQPESVGLHLDHGDELGACASAASRPRIASLKTSQSDLQVTSFPNPLQSSATIRYTLPSAGKVSIKLFDVSGKMIMNVLETYKNSGTHYHQFRRNSLTGGLYYIRLETNNGKEIKAVNSKLVIQ